ncbi:MAG: hypothetical protein V7637_3833 [Mycobacteriales bacterium]
MAVCGPADCGPAEEALAAAVGAALAGAGAVLLCGGGAGVMRAAAAAAVSAGGLAIGVRPGAGEPRPDHLSATVDTAMGQGRNAVLVSSADAVITVGGSWGTLSEVALAMRAGVPVVALGGWQVLDAAGEPVAGITAAADPAAAVQAALAAAARAAAAG